MESYPLLQGNAGQKTEFYAEANFNHQPNPNNALNNELLFVANNSPVPNNPELEKTAKKKTYKKPPQGNLVELKKPDITLKNPIDQEYLNHIEQENIYLEKNYTIVNKEETHEKVEHNKPQQASTSLKIITKSINNLHDLEQVLNEESIISAQHRIGLNKNLLSNWLGAGFVELNEKLLVEIYAKIYLCYQEVKDLEQYQFANINKCVINTILLFCPTVIDANNPCKVLLEQVEQFIKTKASNIPAPIMSNFSLEIPEMQAGHSGWRNAISNTIGIFALETLAEFGIELDTKKIKLTDKTTKKDLIRWTLELKYKNFKQASQKLQELAVLCHKYKVAEDQFKKMINIDNSLVLKKKEFIPNITIVVKQEKNYYWVWTKLPANSKLPYILGNIVPCCQRVGGATDIVIDGMQLENNGFYVLLKIEDKIFKKIKEAKTDWSAIDIDDMVIDSKFDVIGICYLWLSISNSVVLDSVELHPRYLNNQTTKSKAIYMVENFAQEVINKTKFNNVLLGAGGGSESLYDMKTYKKYADFIIEGTMYIDSYHQIILAQAENYKNNFHDKFFAKDFCLLPETIKTDVSEQLMGFNNLEVFPLISSRNAIACYAYGYGMPKDLFLLLPEQIVSLTSEKARNYYKLSGDNINSVIVKAQEKNISIKDYISTNYTTLKSKK